MFNTVYAVIVTSHHGVQRILVRGYKKRGCRCGRKKERIGCVPLPRGERERDGESDDTIKSCTHYCALSTAAPPAFNSIQTYRQIRSTLTVRVFPISTAKISIVFTVAVKCQHLGLRWPDIFCDSSLPLRLTHERGKAYNSVVMDGKVYSSYNVWATATARRWRWYTSALCCWRDLRERDHLENLGVDRILLKWFFKT